MNDIHVKTRKTFGKIVLTVVMAIVFWFYILPAINYALISLHKVTPPGQQLYSVAQIKKDLQHIFKEDYVVRQVIIWDIKTSIPLAVGNKRAILERTMKAGNELSFQIVIADKRWNNSLLPGQRETCVKEAVRFLTYLTDRQYNSLIKAVSFFYNVKKFDYPEILITINIDEFKEKVRELEADGYKGDGLNEKLVEHFLLYYQ